MDTTNPGQGQSVPGETVVYPGPSYTFTGTSTFDNAYVGYNGNGTVTQADGDLTVNKDLYFGYNVGTAGTYDLSGGTLTLNFVTYLGYYGQGTFNQTGGTFTVNSYVFAISNYVGSSGTYNLSGGTLATGGTYVGGEGVGTFTQTGGSLECDGLYVSGSYDSGTGSYSLTGTGSIDSNGVAVGEGGFGVFGQDGGTVTTNGNSLQVGIENGTGDYLLYNGTLYTGITSLGSDGTGTFTQSGGLHFAEALQFGNGVYDLDGGTLKLAQIAGFYEEYMNYFYQYVPGAGTFNFNGGTLQNSGGMAPYAPPGQTGFLTGIDQVNVRDGGAIIDTQTFNATVNQVLSHSVIAGDDAIDGGLTKLGTGTLTLAAADTYTGATTVSAGTLAVTVNGGLGQGDTNVADGAVLSLGSAVTAAHNNVISTTLNLAAATTSVVNLAGSGVQDTVKALYINGAAQPAGTYGAPGSGATYTTLANFTGTGELQVAPDGIPHPSFFSGEVALSNGVYYLQFANGNPFGYYSYLSDSNYIYHFNLGYEYVFDAADGNGGVYFYDFTSKGFFYTSPGFGFPYLYDFTLQTVLYYYPDPTHPGQYNTNGVRYFYDFATGQTISK